MTRAIMSGYLLATVLGVNAIALFPGAATAQYREQYPAQQQYPGQQQYPTQQQYPVQQPYRGQLQVTTTRLEAGTTLSVAPPRVGDAKYFSNDSIHPVSLAVTQDIFDDYGNLAIPSGSTLRGELRPEPGGARFFGSLLVTENRAYSLQAVSTLIHDEKDPRQIASGAIAEDAVIGAAAGAILGVVTGGVSTLGVLGGAAAGVGVGNVTATRAIVLRPEQPLTVSLDTAITVINE